jgi:hypothetical protein
MEAQSENNKLLYIILLYSLVVFPNQSFAEIVEFNNLQKIETIISLYWTKPNEEAIRRLEGLSQREGLTVDITKQIEKAKLHWQIQSALENCIVNNDKTIMLKKRILSGVEGALEISPCADLHLHGLGNLQQAVNATTKSLEKKTLDKIRLRFLDEYIQARNILGDEQDLNELNNFCLSHECPNGARQLIETHLDPSVVSSKTLADHAWQALQNYKMGKYIGSQEGLLLASTTLLPYLKKNITEAEFIALVPTAKNEVLTKIRDDTLGEFKKILNEEGGNQQPMVVRTTLQKLIETYPTLVGTMLAKNPELTSVICYELKGLEAPKSSLEKERDWLWLSGGALLAVGSLVVAPMAGIPLTVGRMANGAMGGLAVSGATQEQAHSQNLLNEATLLRNEFFVGKGDTAILATADKKTQEAYQHMIASYSEAAQVIPIGRIAIMAKAVKIGEGAEQSVASMNLLTNFLKSMREKALNSSFRTNYQKLVSLMPESLDEFDLLMGTIAKLGPKAQQSWFRFFNKLPDHAKERVEKLISFSKKQGCFK